MYTNEKSGRIIWIALMVMTTTLLSPTDTTSVEYRTYREAFPLYHVTRDDPPFFLLHGDADETVPIKNSELMAQALRKACVTVKLVPVPGGKHGREFPNAAEYMREMVRWFDQYLLQK